MQGLNSNVLAESEWILTNNLGGYALGFGNMMNKRKYNGLLVSSAHDFKRNHVLSGIEERLENGGAIFYLDSNHYPNCIYPNGYEHIVKSWLRPYPCLLYSSLPSNEDFLIFKELFFIKGQNAVIIKYTNLGKKEIRLILRPKFTLRDHHMLNSSGTWDRVKLEKEVGTGSFRIKRPDNGIEAFCYLDKGDIIDEQVVFKNVYYPLEAIRGYEAVEDLISPVRIILSLQSRKSSYLVFSATPLTNPSEDALNAERIYKLFPLPQSHPDTVDPSDLLKDSANPTTLFSMPNYLKILELAVRDFLVDDGNIIAGYPWFGPWGRDTLISMSGLKFLPDGAGLAMKILKRYGKHIKSGLLPNTFGEGGSGLNYDTIDAPLWYILRCYEYDRHDRELFDNSCNIMLHFLFEETLPFYSNSDGLIEIRKGDYALTWMDAKLYNSPVTPRWGKPIEINALWYNCLCAVKEMAESFKVKTLNSGQYSCSTEELEATIKRVRASLQKFVGPDYLADRIEDGEPIWEIRPNAVTALSLPFDFVDKKMINRAWLTAKEKLLTPYGLRTLDPYHPAFKQKYIGNQKLRDLSYHQGTVWAYLLLPFAKLTSKVFEGVKSAEDLKREIGTFIWAFRDGFMKGEMSTVAEIWDGVDPYMPKGCPSQAWSTFALFEIEQMLTNAWRLI